jgi:hypothetical protein
MPANENSDALDAALRAALAKAPKRLRSDLEAWLESQRREADMFVDDVDWYTKGYNEAIDAVLARVRGE